MINRDEELWSRFLNVAIKLKALGFRFFALSPTFSENISSLISGRFSFISESIPRKSAMSLCGRL